MASASTVRRAGPLSGSIAHPVRVTAKAAAVAIPAFMRPPQLYSAILMLTKPITCILEGGGPNYLGRSAPRLDAKRSRPIPPRPLRDDFGAPANSSCYQTVRLLAEERRVVSAGIGAGSRRRLPRPRILAGAATRRRRGPCGESASPPCRRARAIRAAKSPALVSERRIDVEAGRALSATIARSDLEGSRLDRHRKRRGRS